VHPPWSDSQNKEFTAIEAAIKSTPSSTRANERGDLEKELRELAAFYKSKGSRTFVDLSNALMGDVFERLANKAKDTPNPINSGDVIPQLLNEAVLLMGEPTEDGLHIMRAEAKIGKVLSLLKHTPQPSPQSDMVAAFRAVLRSMVSYAEWQMSEGKDYHPTLPSAVDSAKALLALQPFTKE